MTMKINGKTSEDIKKGIWRCLQPAGMSCVGCPYNGTCLKHPPEVDALDLIKHLEDERNATLAKVPKWISAKERLPEDCKDVLVWAVYHEEYGRSWALREIDAYCKGVGWENTADPDVREVTHWMLLPSAPEGE